MRAWMVMATAMFVGVGVPGTGRVVPLPIYAAEQATGQAAQVLADMRKALGGAKVEQVKALSLEGPFRREMGQRQMEGTIVLTLQGPDRMHKSEENEFPGGMSVERIQVLAGESAWADVQNRGGMGGGMQIMMRNGPPGAASADPAEMEKRLATQFKTEMQRWMLALLATPAGEVTYAGLAESPDGKADTLEMKDARGQTLRLFVDQETHMPLMLAYSEVRPRIMMMGGPGGPGGRRGPGGRGPGGGAPGGAPGAAPGAGAPGAGAPPPEAGAAPGPGGRPSPEEMRRRMESMPPPAPSAVQMTFAEYATVDGVKLPKRINLSVDGTPTEEWTIEKIKVNPQIKPELFEKKP
ncbi:MAG: hypothetical protein AB7O93_24145 [Vicinamibacterales bacterium]